MAKGDEVIRIDARGVDPNIRSGGRAAHLPEGDYLFKVTSHEVRKSERSGSKYISWTMTCTSQKYKGKVIYHITSLKPDALWNLRNLIFATTGKNIAGKIADFRPKTIYGKVFAGTTEDDSYIKNEGQDDEKEIIRSVLADIRPKEQLDLGDEGDEDDEDEEDEEEYDDEEEEDEEEDEEDEDEEPEPPKKSQAKAKSSAKSKPAKSKRKSRDEDEELEDLDVDEI
jgi:hypothetical protein